MIGRYTEREDRGKPVAGTTDHHSADGDTGPIVFPDSRTPPTGVPAVGRSPEQGGADVPTPPQGSPQTGFGSSASAPPRRASSPDDPSSEAVTPRAFPSRQPAVPERPVRDRSGVVALFQASMFPIGHLPVISDRPEQQLPVPAQDDVFAAMTFVPHDHPQSHAISTDHVLPASGSVRPHRSAPRTGVDTPVDELPEPPPALFEDYDELAAMDEQEWERRYRRTADGSGAYVWPRSEREETTGAHAAEAVMLPPDTLVDRFGSPFGRVFAPDRTAFPQRGLPPAQRWAGYRRYRVLHTVPMWRTASVSWFGQPGGAPRYRALYSADELVVFGYLYEITFEGE